MIDSKERRFNADALKTIIVVSRTFDIQSVEF